MNQPLVAKAHFLLGRMHVDVDQGRVDVDEEHRHRITPLHQQVAVALHDGVLYDAVADVAAVDEGIDVRGRRTGLGRLRNQTADTQVGAVVAVEGSHLPDQGAAENRRDTCLEGFLGVRLEQCPVAVDEPEANVSAGQGLLGDHVGDMPHLGLLAAHEFSPRRRIEKEVTHLDRRSLRRSDLPGFFDATALGVYLPSGLRPGGACAQPQARDRGDRRQRLAAKTERRDGEEIILIAHLAGGMALEGEKGVVLVHAAAVVDNADQALAAAFDLDEDIGGAGIDGILHQFLHHRRRPFDHLAGGNLVAQILRENANVLTHDTPPALLRVGNDAK